MLVSAARVLAVAVLVGNTLYAAPATAGRPMCFGKEATKVGTSGSDTISGTRGDDVIVGLGDRDLIRGLAGNDRICGGGHNDLIYGDNYRCVGEAGRDRLDGGPGQDNLIGDSCRGGKGPGRADILRGGTDPDGLSGGPGDDRLDGEAGRDAFLIVAAGRTKVNLARGTTGGAEGSDRLVSIDSVFSRECRSFGDVIVGNGKRNLISAGEGPDVIRSRGGADRIWSDGKDITAEGAVGSDPCPGGDGDDVNAGGGDDFIRSAEGNDKLRGGSGTDIAKAGTGTDECVGVETERSCKR